MTALRRATEDPSPEMRAASLAETSWEMPTDLVLRFPTASVYRALIAEKVANGQWTAPKSRVFLHHGRYFAEVKFVGLTFPALWFALDIWPLVAKPVGEGRK